MPPFRLARFALIGPPGTAFWYENADGLAEIAVNQGRADRARGVAVGSPVAIVV